MTLSRDALLAEIGRALRQARPDRADGLLQELEYATGRDPRLIVERTDPLSRFAPEQHLLGAILAAANRVEARLPWARRVTWRARLTPIVDTTIVVLGIEAEPIAESARASVLASCFAAAFAPEIAVLASGDPSTAIPDWFFPRIRKLAPTRELESEVTMAVTARIAPAAGEAPPLSLAPPRFGMVAELAPPLRECFPDRAEGLLDDVWELLTVAPPRAKAVRHDGGSPGRTPRELALQVVDLMNAVEAEQPEGLRAQWSAAPAPSDAVDVRASAA